MEEKKEVKQNTFKVVEVQLGVLLGVFAFVFTSPQIFSYLDMVLK
jgi:hypothetical protein